MKSLGKTAAEQPDEKEPVEGESTEPHSVSPHECCAYTNSILQTIWNYLWKKGKNWHLVRIEQPP